ncbi:glucokinase [Agrobacterium tumefaciens]|jgi:glucokinase|uniref:glucokinase n=1 Tax=Agrobacterium tumefaciens TaxID=358 RepID=UPI00157236A7|nr:glucokinase [Agrobacterium tumefaciens]WCK68723.1 glucokinase [Agrobacterium tumefaciens]
MFTSDRHAIVGDVGAEHFRFAVADVDQLTIDHLVNFRAVDFPSCQEALSSYMKSLGSDPPRRASLAVAGYLNGDRAHVCGSTRTFTTGEIKSALSFEELSVCSDAVAVARAAQVLSAHDIHHVWGAHSDVGPRVALAIGNSVRSAMTCFEGTLETWAGNMSFGATDDQDLWFIEEIRAALGGRGAGTLLSTDALLALCNLPSAELQDKVTYTTVSEALAAAMTQPDSMAATGLARYLLWLSRFIQDVALATGARGGVYLADVLSIKLLPQLKAQASRSPSQWSGTCPLPPTTIPVYVVDNISAVLKGAAMACV